MRRVDTSWKIIEGVLWEHTHSVYKALRRPAAEAKIVRLERTVQARLPADFRRSLLIHDGLRELGGLCLFNGLVLLSVKTIVGTWKMRCRVHETTDPGGCLLTMDRRIRNDHWWRPGWVPFLEANGDMVLIDLDPRAKGVVGQVFKFYNSPVRPRQVIADSFTEWLSRVADALAARSFRLSEYGDIWLDDLDLA
jgi:cell wall assembly regulator SMI1